MTPENRQARERIKTAVKRWRCLEPPGFDVKHIFIESDAGDGEETTIANTIAQWEYHSATIKWYLPVAAGISAVQLDMTVVHELVHVLVAPMEKHLRTGKMNETCEHTVEGVARAIIRARKA